MSCSIDLLHLWLQKSAVLVIDGLGSDNETHSVYKAKNLKINFLQRYKHRGIGALYTAITKKLAQVLVVRKTMGLAPYGKKNSFLKI